jgi:hypothetical protein
MLVEHEGRLEQVLVLLLDFAQQLLDGSLVARLARP